MTITRISLLFVLALVCEVGVFATSYQDLLFLRQPVERLLSETPTTFAAQAEKALSRPRLTRQHLETIAATGRGFQMSALEVRSFERLVSDYPSEPELRLRYADALQRSGDYTRAQRIYQDVLASQPAGAQ
jgi:hypothetical protein